MSKKKNAKSTEAPKRRTKTARKATKPAGSAHASAASSTPPKPTKINISAAKGRPMLTWVGKRPLSHVTAFPAQLVERHDALTLLGIPRAASGRMGEEGDYKRRIQTLRELRSQCNEECWKDAPFIGLRAPEIGGLLMHGDNKDVLGYLLANGYRGKVDLIYIDPPFDSGADYVRRVTLRQNVSSVPLNAEQYAIGEQIQYTDIWANDNYLQFMYERLLLMKELLAESGVIYLHCDPARNYELRLLLDEVFGRERFVNEVVWQYTKFAGKESGFHSNHDTLLLYAKSEQFVFHKLLIPAKRSRLQTARVWDKQQKKAVQKKDDDGNLIYYEQTEKHVDDVWTDIQLLNPVAIERTGFPTQKPSQLLTRIIAACSEPGDLILDCFIGSGTTAAVAQKLGRRWIGCDINKGAIQTTVKRLRGIISEQIATAQKTAAEVRQGKLLDTKTEEEQPPKPCAFGFNVWRVNDYDLQIQHNEAVNLACEHVGIERTRSDSYFEGTLGKKLVKIIPFGHPLTPLDLEELRRELDARPDEDRNIVVVCLGMELAAKAWIDDWNRLRKGHDAVNKIDVIELRTDPKYGRFIKHEPASARVNISRTKQGDEARIVVEIQDFISPAIIERLKDQAGLLAPKIEDWRAMVDCIYIDTAYNGSALNVAWADIPKRKSDFVTGKYELPAPTDETTVAVKIVDMLGEEVFITATV